jgi:putative ABC transport system permease protein
MKAELAELGVSVPRLRISDLVWQCLLAVFRHPGRSLVTALGTVLAAAAFVATLGLSSTLQAQVSGSFDSRRATEVQVKPVEVAEGAQWQSQARLARLRALNGVVHAGRRILFPDDLSLRRFSSFSADAVTVKVIGADPGAVRAMAPSLTVGRAYSEFAEARGVRVMMLPAAIARQLGVGRVGEAVFLRDQPYVVMGIYDDVARRPEALQAVLIPAKAAETLVTQDAAPGRDVLIETAAGAAQLVGRQAPLALNPEEPGALEAIAPPDPRTLRQEIEGSVTQISLVLSAVVLVMGTVSIGNAAGAGIAQRVPEIGLRRAVGGSPLHIFSQLLGETAVLGLFGGATGGALGVTTISAVSLWNGWNPVIDLRLALLAAFGGAAAGLLAGLVPAARAMRIQPVAALQR